MGMPLRSPESLTQGSRPPRRHLAALALPGRDERFDPPPPGASVRVLLPPIDSGPAAPLRLTRRGVFAVSVAVALVGAALVWLAALSAPRPPSPEGADAGSPRVVTVRPGDTLWSIAARVAPDTDPLAEVAALQRANHLSGVLLQPGQRLRTR